MECVIVQFKQAPCEVPESQQVLTHYSPVTSLSQAASLMLLPPWGNDGADLGHVRSHIQSDFATSVTGKWQEGKGKGLEAAKALGNFKQKSPVVLHRVQRVLNAA